MLNFLFRRLLSTLPVLWLTVAPAFGREAQETHAGHAIWIVLHALTGLITLAGFMTAPPNSPECRSRVGPVTSICV